MIVSLRESFLLFPVYVHDYLPPMFPELENDDDDVDHGQAVNGDLVQNYDSFNLVFVF
jgi:hypothetical protein